MTTEIEIVCVGDELLDGRVRDRNTARFGELLAGRGLSLRRATTIDDDIDHIVTALQSATARGVDLLICSGGLGPTDDDMTREAAARWLGVELVMHQPSLRRIRERFAERGRVFTQNNSRQALFPDGATPIATEVGTAPGFRVQHDSGAVAFFLPGVPREFEWYLQNAVADHLPPDDRSMVRRSLHFHGIGESALATQIEAVAATAQRDEVSIGYRADYPIIELTLLGKADAVHRTAEGVLDTAGGWLVGEGDADLPTRLGRALLERGETICTAESCTAGGIAALITEIPGSSSWFQRGYVTYANDAKAEELGVSTDILLRYGAVSAQTVCQMASGARRRSRATYGIAVSGIAGPGGGTPDKPVGTVHFGLATPTGVYHRRVHFRLDSRRLVRQGTAYSALALTLWVIEDRLGEHTVAGPFSDAEVWSEQGVTVSEHG